MHLVSSHTDHLPSPVVMRWKSTCSVLRKKIDNEERGEVGVETINLRREVRLKRRTNQIPSIVSHKDDDFDRGILVQADFLSL